MFDSVMVVFWASTRTSPSGRPAGNRRVGCRLRGRRRPGRSRGGGRFRTRSCELLSEGGQVLPGCLGVFGFGGIAVERIEYDAHSAELTQYVEIGEHLVDRALAGHSRLLGQWRSGEPEQDPRRE